MKTSLATNDKKEKTEQKIKIDQKFKISDEGLKHVTI